MPGTSKEICFKNFLSVFQEKDITIVADNCDKSLSWLSPHEKTSYGNAGSLLHCIKQAMSLDDEKLVYFVEDDYLHREGARQVLIEGQNLGEYGTLYDHPDKYTSIYNGGEVSKVIRTMSTHWRFTSSTCMTFFTKVKHLKRDFVVWSKYLAGKHPDDFGVFTELGKPIVVPIPGYACHTDMTFSGATKDMMFDEWAKTLAINNLYCKGFDGLLVNKTSWEKLLLLDAIKQLQQ